MMILRQTLFCVMLFSLGLAGAAAADVRNGSLGQRGANPPYFTQETVAKLRAVGWTCPDVESWPFWWNAIGRDVTVEWPASGGQTGACGRIQGAGGALSGYFGEEIKTDLVLTVWARGEAKLLAGFISYAKDETAGSGVRNITCPQPPPVTVKSKAWIRYRFLLRKTPELYTGHVMISCPEGILDFDEVDLLPATPADVLLVGEAEKLYGGGALVENLDYAAVDDGFRKQVALYRDAVQAFEKNINAIEPAVAESIRGTITRINADVQSEQMKALEVTKYNDMLVLTRVLTSLAGQKSTPPATVVAVAPPPPADLPLPGVRKPRPETVTVVYVRSNKVRYDENETATTRTKTVNTGKAARKGRLVAEMLLDLDAQRKLAEMEVTLGPGETRGWDFSYNVGPETYGRGIEVRFEDEKGEVVDRWREFYAVAAEYFRVQTHSYNGQNELYEVSPWTTYMNQRHYFASEPTDFGVQPSDVEAYVSGQAGYQFNQAGRQNEVDFFRSTGARITFYQTFAFCGPMGYEVMRQHPEFALYDENGQFSVDPIYGGYPNPMELASPIEVGSRRKVVKPYLDRKYTPWPHCTANHAMEEAIVFQANCVKEYAKLHNYDGLYVDGNMGVLKGYGYDGKSNVSPATPEEYARLNGRNHRVFSEILKRENPNFGTWYNWGFASVPWCISVGLTSIYGTGSGLPGDTMDDNIRAATSWKNVMILDETGGGIFHAKSPDLGPQRLLQRLLIQRDYAVQKWEANTIIGYSDLPIEAEKPGPSRWAWPTANYFGAQLMATQMHYAGAFWPSVRPTLQFETRYSRFIWAPDVKTVKEPGKVLNVQAPEDVWWKDFVYRRETESGYDLIVQLVRKPPTAEWSIGLADDPAEVTDAKVTVAIPAGTLAKVQAMRPYYYEEDQQPVETAVTAAVADGKATVTVPPFRYHAMLVFRLVLDKSTGTK